MANSRKKQTRAAGGMPQDEGAAFLSASSHIQHSIEELIPRLINTAAKIVDIKQGREHLIRLMNSAFMATFRGAMKRIDRQLADAEAEYAITLKALADAREIEAVTPEYLPASKVHQGDDADVHQETEWAFWEMRHRFESGLIIACLPIALGSSAYTAYANLVGTSLPVFLDNPILPISMACIAPLVSVAFKTMWHSLRTETARAAFTRYLNYTTLGLVLLWTALFADQFHGLGGGPIAGGIFDEPRLWDQTKETGFTAITLLTEMTVGVVLTHRLDKIAERYSLNTEYRNLNSETIQAKVVLLEAKAKDQAEAIQNLIDKQASYPHSLNLQIETATLAYDARRSRIEDDTL